jgi:hypothetical protein
MQHNISERAKQGRLIVDIPPVKLGRDGFLAIVNAMRFATKLVGMKS